MCFRLKENNRQEQRTIFTQSTASGFPPSIQLIHFLPPSSIHLLKVFTTWTLISKHNQRDRSQRYQFIPVQRWHFNRTPFRLGSKRPPFGLQTPPSGVVEVRCAAAVAVVGNQHLSVLVGPEAVEVDQDAGDGISLATVYQVLESDLIGVFGLHHVEDLILRRNGGRKSFFFLNSKQRKCLDTGSKTCVWACLYLDILEGDRLLSVELYLLLNSLKKEISRSTSVSVNMQLVFLIKNVPR